MLSNKLNIHSRFQVLSFLKSARRSFAQAKQKEIEQYPSISPLWSAFSEHAHPVQRTIRDWDSMLRSTPRSQVSLKEQNGLCLPKITKVDLSFRFKTPTNQPNQQVIDGFNFLRLLSDQKPLISLGKKAHGHSIISVKVNVKDENRVNGIITQLKKFCDLFQAPDEVPKAGLTFSPTNSQERRPLVAELAFSIRNYSMFLNPSVHPGIEIPPNYANIGSTLRIAVSVSNLERDFDVVPFLFQCGIGKLVSKGETGFQKLVLSKRRDLLPKEEVALLREELRLLDLKRRGFLVGGVDKREEAKKAQEKEKQIQAAKQSKTPSKK